MENSDVTVVGCTRCHVRAAVASGLCAECIANDWTLTAEQRAFLDGYRALIVLAQTSEQALDGVRRIPRQKQWKVLFGDMSLDEAIDRWETPESEVK